MRTPIENKLFSLMNRVRASGLFILGFGLTAATVSHADQNLTGNVIVTGGAATGNLNVTGSVDVDGPVVSFGTIGASTVGNSLIFADSTATTGTTGDTLTFSANRTSASWLWLHNASKSAMRLNSLHQLLLYQADGATAGITLTPVTNQISFGSATLTGSGANLTAGGAFTVTGALTASSGITNTTGALTGGSTGLILTAGGTNQNITLTPSGTGNTLLNGKVGIRTTPSTFLHLLGDTSANGVRPVLFESPATDTGISLKNTSAAGRIYSLFSSGTGSGLGPGSFNIADDSAGVARLSITSTGNVGIGTTSPNSFGAGATLTEVHGTTAYGGLLTSTNNVIGEIFASEAGEVYVGSRTSHPLQLATGNLPQMTITAAGNVGLGTTTPSGKLDVVAGLKQEIATYRPTAASGISDFVTGGVGWSLSRPQDGGFAHAIYTYDSAAGAKNNLAISSRSDIVFTAGLSGPSASQERMRISETGNVGIGTTNLFKPLTVESGASAGVNQGIVINSSHAFGVGQGTSASALVFSRNRTIDTSALDVAAQITGGNEFETSSNNGFLNFSTIDGAGVITERMRINSAGNVGIGTTNPTQKLSVAGTVRAWAVVVDTGWSDYVFDDNYRLAPLSEVESHIKAEKHLPGIPSAAEVAEQGVSLGDMQSKLLAKIEELTLRQIAQEKQLNAQASRIAQLEQDNTTLRNR